MTRDFAERDRARAPVFDQDAPWADDGSDVDCESPPQPCESLCVGEAR